MTDWVWLLEDVVLAIHNEQLRAHGGGAGVRDMGLLQSALARPENLVAYGTPDVADLAAAYAYGIARNHAFIDGNKRTAYVAGELFLALNGYDLLATDADAVLTFLALAAGEMPDTELAAWYRGKIKRMDGSDG
jgi:death on curing protein